MALEQPILLDLVEAATTVFRLSWERQVNAWIYTPIGVIIILLFCFGVNSVISISHVSFPASVACMILLFFILLGCSIVLGDRKARKLVALVDIPGGFALRYINVLFCPAFVLIPLGPTISGREIGKIVAVYLIGYLVVFTFTAYLTRGLQFIFGTSKRALAERADELGARNENIPLSEPQVPGEDTGAMQSRNTSSVPLLRSDNFDEIQAPERAQDPMEIVGTGGPPVHEQADYISLAPVSSRLATTRQSGAPLTRAQRWATVINTRIDIFTYLTIFFVVGLPIYLTSGYAMPAQLALTILAYFLALELPPVWRRYLHPALVASVITIVGIYILTACYGQEFREGLLDYRTKTNYLILFKGTPGAPKPGAGDFLSSVLDVSIVALAMPMYQHRAELKRSFFPIVIPTISIAILSLFGYPIVCHAIGISPSRALSFPSRSLTLALATPATQNLGGDLSLVAVLCILSGIMGVIIGQQLLDLLRIPPDDYITRGVTLGGNSSAIATALLLVTDPRAAAFSSLALGLFGTVTVAFSSITPVVKIVQHLAGMQT
ncbi:hypothetical protein, variant [Verruconis gallopava]|uniref:LrgB-like protein n=1 Tax=Verruconis gallopava TaxID=253628 RepID=A0A0D1YZD4_9PEZI|nr:hypothetical protein, variant [Verruconis gallopava]KIW06037.1 hypothetical protein, variant [Verruconis gallopava]